MDITRPLSDVDVALLMPKFHEALDICMEHLRSETDKEFRVYCVTFVRPRKVYNADPEWHTLSMAHMHFLLNAGETGTDEGGDYQIFMLSASGKRLVDTGSLHE